MQVRPVNVAIVIASLIGGVFSGNAIIRSLKLPWWALWDPEYILGHLNLTIGTLMVIPIAIVFLMAKCGDLLIQNGSKEESIPVTLTAFINVFFLGVSIISSVWVVIAAIMATFMYFLTFGLVTQKYRRH